MKPRNFPERVNQRRKGALVRLAQTRPGRMHASDCRRIDSEIVILHSRTASSVRDVRTKKYRGALSR